MTQLVEIIHRLICEQLQVGTISLSNITKLKDERLTVMSERHVKMNAVLLNWLAWLALLAINFIAEINIMIFSSN